MEKPTTKYFLSNFHTNTINPPNNLPIITVTINGQEVSALVDTGAQCSCVCSKANFLDNAVLRNSSKTVLGANNSAFRAGRETNLDIYLTSDFAIQMPSLQVIDNLCVPLIIGADIIGNNLVIRKDYVILQNQKLLRQQSSWHARVKRATRLEPKLDNAVSISNPWYGISNIKTILVSPIILPTKNTSAPLKYMVNEAVMDNTENLSITVSNITRSFFVLPKHTQICSLVPCSQVERVNGIFSCENVEQEMKDVQSFQEARKTRFSINQQVPEVKVIGTSDTDRVSDLNKLLKQNNLAFCHDRLDVGKIGGYRFTIPLNDENKVIYGAPRNIPPALKEKVKVEFAKWEGIDLVEESNSNFNIPMLVVRKPDGSVRLALDARDLNANSKFDRFPLPNLENLMDEVGRKIKAGPECYISTLDFSRAFNQVQLKSEDRDKCAFTALGKHWRPKRLVYGLGSAPSGFTRIMSKIFSDLEGCWLFIDDIILISNSWEEHLELLNNFFVRCIKYGITIDPKKTSLDIDAIDFLGERVNKNGRMPSNKHLEAINNYNRPMKRSELRRFLGMTAFVQRHVQDARVILQPLHKLSSIKVPWVWLDIHQSSFDEFKDKLSQSTGLTHRDPASKLYLVCDASIAKCGAILYQVDNSNVYTPLGYFSRIFTKAEMRHSSRARECYCIVDSIKFFSFHLIGEHFKVITDHRSLLWLAKESKSNQLSPRLVNIYIFLSGFNFEIEFRRNTDPAIVASDAISRSYTLSDLEQFQEESSVPDYLMAMAFLPAQAVNTTNNSNRYWLRSAAQLVNPECDQEQSLVIPEVQQKRLVNIAFEFGDTSIDINELSDKQKSDSFCQNILKKISIGVKANSQVNNFAIENNLLYKMGNNGKLRLVIPVATGYEFCSFLHSIHMHPGSKSLERIVSKIVYIHGLQKICQNICHQCVTCIRNKPRPMLRPSKVPNRSFSSYPFERTYIDLVDMGQKDRCGKRYLLTFVCEQTGYLDGYALPSKRDDVVAKAVMELALRNGALNEFVTDRGTEFSKYFSAVTEKLGIRHIRTSAYNSRANFAERIHRDFATKLRLLGCGKQNWSNVFPLLKFHINSSPRDRLDGLTPNECVYGRPFFLPFSTIEALPVAKTDWVIAVNEYFRELYPSLLKFQMDRYNNLVKLDKGKAPILKVGDKVLCFKPNLYDHKYISTWEGPFLIKRKLARDTYIVKDPKTHREYHRHIRRLRVLPNPSHTDNPEIDNNSAPIVLPLGPGNNEIISDDIPYNSSLLRELPFPANN